MRKWTVPTLGAILALAIIVRLWPLLNYEIWGSDSGEYFRLTEGLVRNGTLTTEYTGWGLAYPFFQGMEVLIGTTAQVTGLEVLALLKVLVPVVSSTGVIIVFMIGRTAFTDERAGLIAAGVIAVAMPQVFSTSHAMPGTLGDFLALSCIFLFLKAYEHRGAMIPLMFATVALIMTHHLSTFFVLVPILFAVFVREFIRTSTHPTRFPVDVVFIGFMLVTTLAYWLGVAVPFRDEVMVRAFGVDPFFIAAAAVGLIFLAVVVVLSRRRFLMFRYTPRYPSVKREIVMLMVMGVCIFGTLTAVALFSVPGTDIEVVPTDMLRVAPSALFAIVAVIGIGPAEFSRRGFFILSWLGATGLIFLIGVVTNNTVLIPYRQFQYMMVPLGLMAGWGMVYLVDAYPWKGLSLSRPQGLAIALVIAGLILASGTVAMPTKGLVGGFEEGTVDTEMDGVRWCSENLPIRGTMVATDHRMSSMLFGFSGQNGTWDSAYDTFHGDLDQSREELREVTAPAGKERIDYVFLSDPIKEGVALVQWENAEPMSKGSLDKFREPPFQLIYDSNGVLVYFVGAV